MNPGKGTSSSHFKLRLPRIEKMKNLNNYKAKKLYKGFENKQKKTSFKLEYVNINNNLPNFIKHNIVEGVY